MIILYGSANAAAVPVSIVRARTPGAPAGDLARFARKTTCDAGNRFSFEGLPEGSWFVITIAKSADGQGRGSRGHEAGRNARRIAIRHALTPIHLSLES